MKRGVDVHIKSTSLIHLGVGWVKRQRNPTKTVLKIILPMARAQALRPYNRFAIGQTF